MNIGSRPAVERTNNFLLVRSSLVIILGPPSTLRRSIHIDRLENTHLAKVCTDSNYRVPSHRPQQLHARC